MPTTFIVDKDGNQVDASTVTVPSDRHFREAWSLSGRCYLRRLNQSKRNLQR